MPLATGRVAACAAVLALAAACSLFERSPAAGVGNVVILSVDALSPRALRPYDPSAQALPNLEGFARRAVIFRSAFTSASWTLPAHASLLTGL